MLLYALVVLDGNRTRDSRNHYNRQCSQSRDRHIGHDTVFSGHHSGLDIGKFHRIPLKRHQRVKKRRIDQFPQIGDGSREHNRNHQPYILLE